jgi:hypothetical protein
VVAAAVLQCRRLGDLYLEGVCAMGDSARQIQPTRLHPLLWLLAVPLGIVLAPILALIMVAHVVVWPVLVVIYLCRRRQFLHRQRAAGLLMLGQTARERAAKGEGVLLVELQPTGMGGDIWFIEGLIAPDSEVPPPVLRSSIAESAEEFFTSPAAVQWCETQLPALRHKSSLVQMTWRERRQLLNDLPLPFVRGIWCDYGTRLKA